MSSILPLPSRFIGCARVSTQAQDLAYQLRRLKAAGCSKVFQEKRSGKNRDDRPVLEHLLTTIREGDLLMATVSDRVARDPLDLLNIIDFVKKAGAEVRLLDEPYIDTMSAMWEVHAVLVGWAGRWQRLRILENTANGRAVAKERGVKFGRKPKLSAAKKAQVLFRRQNGELVASLALAFGVSQSTIVRVTAGIGQ